MKWKLLGWLATSIIIGVICFVGYGVKTQCKNVAVYNYCDN